MDTLTDTHTHLCTLECTYVYVYTQTYFRKLDNTNTSNSNPFPQDPFLPFLIPSSLLYFFCSENFSSQQVNTFTYLLSFNTPKTASQLLYPNSKKPQI